MDHTISVAGNMRIAFSALLLLGATACSRAPAPGIASAAPTERATESNRIAAKQAALASLDSEELKRLGQDALRNQRIYSPAGNNALEYYIALRNMNSTADDATTNALSDLLPYAVIAAEQAISRADIPEAERLHLLIAAADPAAPSLERLAAEIAEGKRVRDAETREAGETIAEQEKQQPAAQPDESTPTLATMPPSAPVIATASAPMPHSQVIAVAPAPPTPAAASSSFPEAASVSRNSSPAIRADQLVEIRTVQPAYPKDELRHGAVVSVTATFTVNADGSVGDVQLEGGGAAFARSVRAALRRWQFQPLGQSMVVTRQFNFSP